MANAGGGGASEGNEDFDGVAEDEQGTDHQDVEAEALDFTEKDQFVAIPDKRPFDVDLVTTAYDPRPHEDGARRAIALLLIGLLWLVVAAMLELLAFRTITVVDLKEFAVLLGPIVTLVSAATGFYYGTKSNSPPSGAQNSSSSR